MTEKLESDLKEIIKKCSNFLKAYEERREDVMKLNREAISYSARCTEASKRREKEKASRYLSEARERIRKCHEIIAGMRQAEKLYSSISEGEKELVEAALTYSYIFNESYQETLAGLNPFSIILGIMDFSGELRRIFVESLASNEFEKAKRIVDLLRDMYLTMIYEDIRLSVVPGFKRRLDILRSQIERCIEDLNLSCRLAGKHEFLGGKRDEGKP